MTNPSHGPSLLQAREDTRSQPHPHSLFHRRRQPDGPRGTTQTHHEHHRYPREAPADDRPRAEPGADDTAQAPPTAVARDIAGDVVQRDAAFAGAGVDTVVNVIKDPGSPFVTRVVQTVSLVQVVDPWGKPWETRTVLGPPNTVVLDPSGNTVAVTAAGLHATVAAFGATPSTTATTAPESDTDSTAPPTTEPSQASSLTSTPSHTPSTYPIISDARNGTNTLLHGNSSFVHSNSSSYRTSALSTTTSLSFTSTSTDSTSEESSVTTTSSEISTTASSTHLTTTTTSSFTLLGGGFVATKPADGAQPSPTSDSGGHSPDKLSPQQKQVIGGVVGSIAGVAFLALLVLLALKYKRRRDGRQLIGGGQSGQDASRSITGGDGGSGASRAMAERSGPSAAVTAALATLTGKRNARQTASSSEGTERGFYRVSGRKLPSVLHTGGDGYSDPRESTIRESTISGSSDYYRGSQSFDPAAVQAGHLALGAPMRPVSGVPVMRSGPARVPVTENPFDDPATPTSPTDMSSRNLGSRESPRAQGSRFQEGI
ncbi:hypothetical protein Purlil1_11006 [Purpureocillium lilacinum]|uniref:Uncharacterized protein n=1 Tax=Purpureocillium lilacinum TaxID=33203 RepID=A0ABR0BKW0_PURLI|nr:hypothetical protein Purlil1_11006 [Purpureocillium lilacinum]